MERGEICAVLVPLSAQGAPDLLGPAWLAMNEAARLYDVDGGTRPLVIPIEDRSVEVQPAVTRLYVGPRFEDQPSVLGDEQYRELAREVATGSFVDQRELVAVVGEVVGAGEAYVVAVTDLPIVPPPNYRYLIWDAVAGGAGVSMATLDPRFWGDPCDERQRRRTVKRRLRAALCSVLGTALGLVRCDNPRCFLYADVDRVTRLDDFVRIGEEHGVDDLSGRGFPEETNDLASDRVVAVDAPLP